MEYAPVRMAFTESKDGGIKATEIIRDDRITEESKINKKYDNWYLTMSDFQKVILNTQHEKLAEKSRDETKKKVEERIKQNLLNLSIIDLYKQMNEVFVDILNDTTVLLKKKTQTNYDKMIDFIYIITRNDRLFYVGIFFCIIAFCLFIIQSTSN
jgi:hypothetical protein